MKDLTSISRRGLVGGAAALACGVRLASAQDPKPEPGAPPVPDAAPPAQPRLVILVRHGEKGTDDPRDPSLSEAGKARAAALARLLGDTPVTHVFTTEYKRTKEFGATIATPRKLTATALPARDSIRFAESVKALPAGSIALVVGHSNTLPSIARALGAPLSNLAGATDMREDEYDRFIAITLLREGDPSGLLELRYGA